jgi:fructose-bisphosphate aldolase class II
MPYDRGTALAEVYGGAREGGYGFVASNVTHPDIATGLLRGAEAAGSDLVLQVKRDTAEYLGDGDAAAGLRVLGAQVRELAAGVDVGVFLNVDHVAAADEALLAAAIGSGLPASVMVDASDRPFEENVLRTRAAVERVADANAAGAADLLVEAELGTVAGEEGGEVTDEALYTDPAEAVAFVERTGCDLLAVSLGTEHGVSKGRDLDLRIDRAREVDAALREAGFEVPLVVHGSSGLTPEQVTALMETGVCKLNTNTRYQYEYARTACEYYRDHADAILPPEGVADDRATFFSGADWSPVKAEFDPQAVGEATRERIAAVYGELAEVSGSAGESRYA